VYQIRELTPDLLDDYLAFFDKDAFADNPGWGNCYCRFHHFPHAERDWRDTTAEENRTAVIDLIKNGTLHGYLAYSEGRPVGWCNAGPRLAMTTVPDYPEPDAARIGSIACFVIAKAHRRKGLARRLLEAACTGFVSQGFTIAEACVFKGAEGDARNYPGPISMYHAAGFTTYRELINDGDDTIVLRKALPQPV
jgi:GNAT superfamily N-acetyltransferase